MVYELPQQRFEEMIGKGLWVDHEFELHGDTMRVVSIGQCYVNAAGKQVVPVEIECMYFVM